jgi:hypothetical protein
MPPKSSLSPDEILSAEFDYISSTAFQANEDRARVASFYLVTFGSFIAALLSAQLNIADNQAAWVQWGFFGLFMALALMGLLTILQLARLRVAWFESVQAMNAIKEYYIEHFPELEKAIKWRSASRVMPARLKFNSVGFMLMVQVAILGGAAFGTGIFFVVRALADTTGTLLSILLGVVYFFALLEIYRQALK